MPLLSLSFPTSSSSFLHHQHGHHASRDVCGPRFSTYFSLKPHGLRSNRSIRFRVLLSSSSSSHPSLSIDGTGSGNAFGDVIESDSELEVDEEEDSDSEALIVDRWDILGLGQAMITVYKTESRLCAAFLANDDPQSEKIVNYNGKSYWLLAWSVSILPGCKNVALNTAKDVLAMGMKNHKGVD